MNNDYKNFYFNQNKIKFEMCLEPNGRCLEKPIRAHSIQNSKTLDLICKNNHVIMLLPSLKTDGPPEIEFQSIGRNKASTFRGLCSIHDTGIFSPIEMDDVDFCNPEHLFLIAYRAVLKETHACYEAAHKIQSAYTHMIDIGLSSKEQPDNAGILSAELIARSYRMSLYKEKYDQAYILRNYSTIGHHHFEFENTPPTISASSLFSLDDIECPDDVVRLSITAIPSRGKMNVVFSFLNEEASYVNQFLHPTLNATGYYQKYLISRIVLEHCENFVIAPDYYKTMPEAKKKAVLGFFRDTLIERRPDIQNQYLYLF